MGGTKYFYINLSCVRFSYKYDAYNLELYIHDA